MKSDIIITGKHAEIINNFKNFNLLVSGTNTSHLFFISVLIGLYNGKIAEPEPLGEEKIDISRLYASNNPNKLDLINTFANLEDKYNGLEMSTTEIFNDEEKTNNNEKIRKIKAHGLYGLEYLNEIFFQDTKIFEEELDLLITLEENLKTTEELSKFEIIKEPNTEYDFEGLLTDE